jgi:putative ABC transport system permease protein
VSKGNEDFFDRWDLNDVQIFVKLKENVNSKEFENKIKYLFDDFLEDREDELKLKPIRIIKLLQSDGSGYWIVVSLYGIVGLFTLLLAAMNFVNLTTAYSLNRAKEIGIKKVLGCKRKGLIQQFLGESLIIVFISLLIAFTITEAALPVFSRIVSLPLDLKYIEDWSFTLFIIGIAVLTGILSGLYPSLVLSSLSPMRTLKSKFFDNDRIKKLSMRKGLVVFQLVMSIVFVMFALSILSQFNYLKNKDLGFDKQNLIICKIQETEEVKTNEFSVLRNELLRFPDIEEVSLSFTLPFNGSWTRTINWEGSQVGEKIHCRYNRASPTFIPTLKLGLIAGRNFDDKIASDLSGCIVNQAFVDVIGWGYQEAIGKRVWDNRYTIVGVMKDFHEQSPVAKIPPYLLRYHPGYLTGTKKILIRVKDISDSEVSGFIKTKLEEFFPESNFEVRPYDENLGEGTQKVFLGLAKTFGFFSVISIIISIIGLFALISFSGKRKVKEIGIRKVLGARPMQIYMKLAREYIILILIANAIAIPLGKLMTFMDPSHYKQHISVNQIISISILSFVITLLTISIQVIKSSRANPVESLRYE